MRLLKYLLKQNIYIKNYEIHVQGFLREKLLLSAYIVNNVVYM